MPAVGRCYQDSIMIVTEKDFNAGESGDVLVARNHYKTWPMKEIINDTFKETGRMLIFSNYYNSFTKIKEILSETGVKFKEIKGTGTMSNQMYKDTDELNCLSWIAQTLALDSIWKHTDLVLYHNMSSELSIRLLVVLNVRRTSSLKFIVSIW